METKKKEEVPIIWGKDDGVHFVTGTYKKDTPNEEIGYQKFRTKQRYIVDVEYDIVARTQEEADSLAIEKTGIEKVEFEEGYGKTFRETTEVYLSDTNRDSADDFKVEKIEECIPTTDSEWSDKENRSRDFTNYEDCEWTSDEYEFKKNPDGTDIDENKK